MQLVQRARLHLLEPRDDSPFAMFWREAALHPLRNHMPSWIRGWKGENSYQDIIRQLQEFSAIYI